MVQSYHNLIEVCYHLIAHPKYQTDLFLAQHGEKLSHLNDPMSWKPHATQNDIRSTLNIIKPAPQAK
jgi:hypothetical protein